MQYRIGLFSSCLLVSVFFSLSIATGSRAHAQQPLYTLVTVYEMGPDHVPVFLPCVRLTTHHSVEHVTDQNGNVAFHEPGLTGIPVWFFVEADGYVFNSIKVVLQNGWTYFQWYRSSEEQKAGMRLPVSEGEIITVIVEKTPAGQSVACAPDDEASRR
jgi:hypothetical protein